MFTHKHESNDEKWRWRVNCCVYVPQWRAFISAFKREMFFFSFQRRPSMQGLIFNSIRIVVLFWAVRWGVEQQRDRGTRLKVTATFYVCWWIINTGIFSVIPTHLTLLSICVCVCGPFWVTCIIGRFIRKTWSGVSSHGLARFSIMCHCVYLCTCRRSLAHVQKRIFGCIPSDSILVFFLRAQRILARSVS